MGHLFQTTSDPLVADYVRKTSDLWGGVSPLFISEARGN
jgi:hypothetical protein